MNNLYDDYMKVIRIFESCESKQQYNIAFRVFSNFYKLHRNNKRLVDFMRRDLKIEKEKAYNRVYKEDLDKVVDERRYDLVGV